MSRNFIFTLILLLSLAFIGSSFLLRKEKQNVLTSEERTFLVNLLENSLTKFERCVADLTEAQLAFRPAKNKWTIAECIEHICLAELRFPQIVGEELQKPAEPARRKKIKVNNEQIIRRLTNRRWRAKAPEIFTPSGRFATIEDAKNTFRNQRLQTINYVLTTNDDLRNHFWRHPATGVVDLYQTMVLMSAHLERHLAQIEEIKVYKSFPTKK